MIARVRVHVQRPTPSWPRRPVEELADDHRTIDHINIATERLEETRAFFVDVLGLVEGYRPAMVARLERHGVAYRAVMVPGTAIRQAFLQDPNGVRLELNHRPG